MKRTRLIHSPQKDFITFHQHAVSLVNLTELKVRNRHHHMRFFFLTKKVLVSISRRKCQWSNLLNLVLRRVPNRIYQKGLANLTIKNNLQMSTKQFMLTSRGTQKLVCRIKIHLELKNKIKNKIIILKKKMKSSKIHRREMINSLYKISLTKSREQSYL